MWTVENLITESWEQIGRPSDISPLDLDGNFDLNLEGSQQILRWLNWGQRHICTWKFPNGELVRFSDLYRRTRFSTRPYTAEATAYDPTTGQITLAAALPDWILSSHMATEHSRHWVELIAIDATTLKAVPEPAAFSVGEFLINRREYYYVSEGEPGSEYNIPLSPVTQIDSVQRITDLRYGREVVRGARTDYWPLSSRQQSPSMAYNEIGGGIVFDRIPEDNEWYLLEYYALPDDMALATDYPRIPAQFHEGVMLHAVWFGLRRQQEWSGAYSTKRDLQEFMQGRRKQFEAAWDYSNGFLRIES